MAIEVGNETDGSDRPQSTGSLWLYSSLDITAAVMSFSGIWEKRITVTGVVKLMTPPFGENAPSIPFPRNSASIYRSV
jgi:hypothetical protein